MAKVNVLNQIIIQRPIEQVARYAAHPDSAPDWYINIKSVEWRSTGGLELGAKVAFIANFLGKELSYTYEIYDYIPGKHLFMRTVQGSFPMETRYTWVATKNGYTKMTLQNIGKAQGFSGLAKPFINWSMNRANKKDLKKLKLILEEK